MEGDGELAPCCCCCYRIYPYDSIALFCVFIHSFMFSFVCSHCWSFPCNDPLHCISSIAHHNGRQQQQQQMRALVLLFGVLSLFSLVASGQILRCHSLTLLLSPSFIPPFPWAFFLCLLLPEKQRELCCTQKNRAKATTCFNKAGEARGMCTGVRDDWEGKERKEREGGRSPIERHNCLQSTIHMAVCACVYVCRLFYT